MRLSRVLAVSIVGMVAQLGIANLAIAQPTTRPARPFYRGVDISMLPEIEKAGGVFLDDAGSLADAVTLLRDHGVNLYRIRLFVEPSKDFNKVFGATQDLPVMRTLAKRIKGAGGLLLLDLHYSDTWADGEHQAVPRAWAGQSFSQLELTVHDYTASVLADLKRADAMPDMVQIGNEIAGGMLFPSGQVLRVEPADAPAQWAKLSRLLNAGARAVREGSTPAHRIEVMIHIHGGGRVALPQWFFEKLQHNPVDFDVIGLSVYPEWGDALDVLNDNLCALDAAYHKPIVVAETAYPSRRVDDLKDKPTMRWPQTPDGQRAFLRDVTAVLRAAPNRAGAGYIWWYPEALPIRTLSIWRDGAEALFDASGRPQPALDLFRAD